MCCRFGWICSCGASLESLWSLAALEQLLSNREHAVGVVALCSLACSGGATQLEQSIVPGLVETPHPVESQAADCYEPCKLVSGPASGGAGAGHRSSSNAIASNVDVVHACAWAGLEIADVPSGVRGSSDLCHWFLHPVVKKDFSPCRTCCAKEVLTETSRYVVSSRCGAVRQSSS